MKSDKQRTKYCKQRRRRMEKMKKWNIVVETYWQNAVRVCGGNETKRFKHMLVCQVLFVWYGTPVHVAAIRKWDGDRGRGCAEEWSSPLEWQRWKINCDVCVLLFLSFFFLFNVYLRWLWEWACVRFSSEAGLCMHAYIKRLFNIYKIQKKYYLAFKVVHKVEWREGERKSSVAAAATSLETNTCTHTHTMYGVDCLLMCCWEKTFWCANTFEFLCARFSTIRRSNKYMTANRYLLVWCVRAIVCMSMCVCVRTSMSVVGKSIDKSYTRNKQYSKRKTIG